jgi:hypothetical protein
MTPIHPPGYSRNTMGFGSSSVRGSNNNNNASNGGGRRSPSPPIVLPPLKSMYPDSPTHRRELDSHDREDKKGVISLPHMNELTGSIRRRHEDMEVDEY